VGLRPAKAAGAAAGDTRRCCRHFERGIDVRREQVNFRARDRPGRPVRAARANTPNVRARDRHLDALVDMGREPEAHRATDMPDQSSEPRRDTAGLPADGRPSAQQNWCY
jgi:hypothetical protein